VNVQVGLAIEQGLEVLLLDHHRTCQATGRDTLPKGASLKLQTRLNVRCGVEDLEDPGIGPGLARGRRPVEMDASVHGWTKESAG